MGGKVAQLLASRPLAGLKGMVLLAPAPAGRLTLPSEEMKEQQMQAYDSPQVAEFVVRQVLTAGGLADEDIRMLVEDTQRGNQWAKKAWPSYGMEEDYSGDLHKIGVPVKIVVGELDKLEPAERMRTEIIEKIKKKGASMVIVEGSGHMLPVEQPAKVADEIKAFCDSLKPVI
jgi:3-oxoadipate enol-lactonase